MARVSEEQVLRALETVTDFDHGADVVSLGMISGVVVNNGTVTFAVEVDPAEAVLKEPLRAACERTVKNLLGVNTVTAVLTAHREAAAGAGIEPTRDGAPGDVADAQAAAIREQVIEALHSVFDPEIPVDIYELGLIYRVVVDADRHVFIEMTLTAPGCPVAGTLPGEVEDTVRMTVSEASDVKVDLVWDPPWTKDRMSEAARLELGFF